MSKNSTEMSNDMSNLCRVCLQLPQESQYLDLTTIYDEEDNLTYGECFTICTQIDLSAGEGVPHHLCKSCGLELQMSYDFLKKVEESKRVIEQYQMQIKEEHHITIELPTSREQTKSFDNNKDEPTIQINNEKYVASDEEHLPALSEGMEEDCIMQEENVQVFDAPTYVNEDADEIEIIKNVCHTETSLQNQAESHENNPSLIEIVNESDGDHIEMNDYHNMEALDDAEKTRKLITNIKIKTENLIDEIHTQTMKDELNATTEYDLQTFVIREIKKEATETHDNKTPADIKIEKETVSEYILPSPVIPPHSSSDIIPANIQQQQQAQDIGAPFTCEFCGYSLPTKNAVYKHNQRKHKYERSFLRNSMPAPLKCLFCSKTFSKIASLRQHLDEKHSRTNFVCEDCGHKLPTKNALCQHRLRKHPEAKKQHAKVYKFKCSLCTESFITAKRLNLHKKNVHSKKPVVVVKEVKLYFQCEDCDHKLPTKNALYQHRLRKHRNKKVASDCSKTILPCYERLASPLLLESHEALPALKQMVERF